VIDAVLIGNLIDVSEDVAALKMEAARSSQNVGGNLPVNMAISFRVYSLALWMAGVIQGERKVICAWRVLHRVGSGEVEHSEHIKWRT
jgi:hypothetical protein